MELLSPLIMFAIMFGIMYFLLIRPQKKQQEKVKNMLDSLAVGDSIVTIGGMHGILDEINDEAQTVVIDCEGIYLTFERRAISRIVAKGTDPVVADVEDLGTNEPDAVVEENNLPED